MNTKSLTAPPVPQHESLMHHLPIVDLVLDTRTKLLDIGQENVTEPPLSLNCGRDKTRYRIPHKRTLLQL